MIYPPHLRTLKQSKYQKGPSHGGLHNTCCLFSKSFVATEKQNKLIRVVGIKTTITTALILMATNNNIDDDDENDDDDDDDDDDDGDDDDIT